jgi:outer membrane protein assembly factor BamB
LSYPISHKRSFSQLEITNKGEKIMQMARNKTAIAIALFLTLTMTVSLVALPAANAQGTWSIYINARSYDWRIRMEVRLDNSRQRETFTGVILHVLKPGDTAWTTYGPYSTDDGRVTVYYDDFASGSGYLYGDYVFQWMVPAQDPLPDNPDTTDGEWYSANSTLTLEEPVVPEGMFWDLPFQPSDTRLLLWERFGDRIPTYLFLVGSPNPVGVGQRVSFIMMNPQQPPGASASNDVRYDYSMKVEDPDGDVETLGPFTSDATGTAYTLYTPDKVGNYTVTITFNELFYDWHDGSSQMDYYGTTFLASSDSITIVVQEEPVKPSSWVPTPLPTEYWTRPIEGQNTDWWRVASNWLAGPGDKNYLGSENRWQRDGTAPNSAHILWTRPVEDGGLVGGGNFSVPGEVFNAGHQYQTRHTNPIIMWGRLYYEIPVQWSGGGGGWMCVDLKTGEEIWYQPFGVSGSGMSEPSFGYYYDLDNMNNHGVVTPGWLFTSNFGHSIHPRYGTYDTLSLEGVPSGYELLGPKGEHLRYNIYNAGTSSNPDYHLRQWNSSKVFDDSETGTRTVNDGDYDWDIPLPVRNGMTGGSVTIRAVEYNKVLVGSNGSSTAGTNAPQYHRPSPVTFWAVNLDPDAGTVGSLMWMENIDQSTPDNTNVIFERAGEGVLCFVRTPKQSWMGYSMYTGEKLWETGNLSDINPFGYFSFPSLIHVASSTIAYGTLFTGGYVGHVSAWNITTGELMWRYAAPTQQRIFLYYTLMLGCVADGKIYVGTHEHSADTPLFKGNQIRALNVTTGEEVWTMAGWAHPYTFAVADGVLTYWNNYDHQVYAVGKGPTDTEVSIQNDVITHGDSVLIKGSVMDISAGTKQQEQAMRFPDGVPAVSEDSMGAWMEYVYMQKARPSNATGVEVLIDVLDSNGNYRNIGTATSDASGFYSLAWTPDIPGKYTVIARFAGSEGYWQSSAETAFNVEEAPEATPPPTPEPASTADLYFVPATAGIIVAIAVVGVVLILMLRKR